MTQSVGVNGAWRPVTSAWVGVAGAWHQVVASWVGVDGAWRQVSSAAPLSPPAPTPPAGGGETP